LATGSNASPSGRGRREAAGEGALELAEAERAVLTSRLRAFADAFTEPAARARYLALADAAASGAVPHELVGPLETMLELLLQRAPTDSEPVLSSVYKRTPRGQALTTAAHDVNTALRALRGQRLETLRLAAAPGRQTLTLETDKVRIVLAVDNAGPRVESLESTA
jgi:hypothetical protein